MSNAVVSLEQAETFSRCMSVGGIAVFPADTVYGLACEPAGRDAVERLYALKGRVADKPTAVMFFSVGLALSALPELGPRTRAAIAALLPGALTLLLPNPAQRFPLACVPDAETLGLRVPALSPALDALAGVRWPILQTSANRAGEPDACRLADVPAEIREGADLVIDGGELPGIASTVLDLRAYELDAQWAVRRHGAVAEGEIAARLA